MKRLKFSASLLALLPLLAHAAGGAYEINQDCAVAGCFGGDAAGFPVTITKAGAYVLTSDLLISTGGADAIDIVGGVSPVDIDLNGHTINGGGFCINSPVGGCSTGAVGFYGINQVYASPPGVLHVHDGTIKGFTYTTGGVQPAAIFLGNAGDGSVVERVNLLENGGNGAISAFSDVVGTLHVRDSRISRNRYDGLFSFNVNSNLLTLVVENSEFSANGAVGIHEFSKSTITGSRFYGNGGQGISGTSSTYAIGQNTFNNNLSGGVQYAISTKRDMGGNVCIVGTCP